MVVDYVQLMLEIKVIDGCVGEGLVLWMMYFDYVEIEEGVMGQMVEDCYL